MTGLHPAAKAFLWLLLAGGALALIAGCSVVPSDRHLIIQDDRMEHGSFYLGQAAQREIVVTTVPYAV